MSNASVISRQASCSSILVRTSPDDAKRPESTMVTVQEHPEETGTNISSVEETGSKPSPYISKTPLATKPTPPKTSAPLRRTMSKSVITHSKSTTNMTKPMNRQMSRTMSKAVLRIGEHRPVSSEIVIKELTAESKTGNTGTGPVKTETTPKKTETGLEKTEARAEITEERPDKTETHTEKTGTEPDKTETRAEIIEEIPDKTEKPGTGPEKTETKPEEGKPEVASLETPKESGNITSDGAIKDANIELASDDEKKRNEIKTE